MLLSISIILSALLVSFDSSAHKMKTAFTIILFNERTDNLEVVHRFYLHDAEEAVWEIFDGDNNKDSSTESSKKADIIGDEITQQNFSEYVINHFALKDQFNKTIPLSTVGFHNDGGYFWVYQETKAPKHLSKLHIKQNALMDIWSQQYNVVNIEGLDKVYTLNFSSSDDWLSIPINAE